VSDIFIRKARIDDCEVIVAFISSMLKEMSDMGGHPLRQNEAFWISFRNIVLSAIKSLERLYLIAEDNEGHIGFLEGRVNKLYEVFEPKKSFHISSIYVNPDKRNCGVATNLIRAGLRWAAEKGCQETDLNILVNNKKAKGLYKKLGFTIFRHEMRMQLPTIK